MVGWPCMFVPWIEGRLPNNGNMIHWIWTHMYIGSQLHIVTAIYWKLFILKGKDVK